MKKQNKRTKTKKSTKRSRKKTKNNTSNSTAWSEAIGEKQQKVALSSVARKQNKNNKDNKNNAEKENPISAFIRFLRESKVELSKVTWPTKKELIATTIAVIVLSLIVSFYLGAVDFILIKVIKHVVS